MYGTIARLKLKPGQEAGMREYFAYWQRERQPQVPGALAAYVYQLDDDPQTWMMAVVFRDRESYRRNADSPEMEADYQRLRSMLAEDPVWHDGEVVAQL